MASEHKANRQKSFVIMSSLSVVVFLSLVFTITPLYQDVYAGEVVPSSTEPDQVTGLVATSNAIAIIDLAWNEPANGGEPITGYKIERESPIGGGFIILVADTGTTATTFEDIGLMSATQYNYKVSAINAIGTGIASDDADATTASPPSNGDIIVVDRRGLLAVDPITGAQTLIAKILALAANDPTGVAVDADGNIIVATEDGQKITKVNPITGSKTVIASGIFNSPSSVTIDSNGNFIVSIVDDQVLKVDSVTGMQTIISSGGLLDGVTDSAIDANEDIIVVDVRALGGAIIKVDPMTGTQTLITSGGSLTLLSNIVIDSNGDYIVTNGTNTLVKVDSISTSQTVISSGGFFDTAQGLVIDSNGDIIVADNFALGGSIIKVNPLTGAQTVISSDNLFHQPMDVAIFTGIPATLKITKIATDGNDTFDFIVTGPTPSSPSITTSGGGGSTVIFDTLGQPLSPNELDVESFVGTTNLGQFVTLSNQQVTGLRMENIESGSIEGLIQARIYSGVEPTQIFTTLVDTTGQDDSTIDIDTVTGVASQHLLGQLMTVDGRGQSISKIIVRDVDFTNFNVGDWTGGGQIRGIVYRPLDPGLGMIGQDNVQRVIDTLGYNPAQFDEFAGQSGVTLIFNFSSNSILDQSLNTNFFVGLEGICNLGSCGNILFPTSTIDLGGSEGQCVQKPTLVFSNMIACPSAADFMMEVELVEFGNNVTDSTLVATSDTIDLSDPKYAFNLDIDVTFNFTAPVLSGNDIWIGLHVQDIDDFLGFPATDVDAGGDEGEFVFSTDLNPPVGELWVSTSITDRFLGGGGGFSQHKDLLMQVIGTGDGMGMDGPNNVDPGTYSVQETIPSGWDLITASCNDGSSAFSVDTVSGIVIDSGDNIECTFENIFSTQTEPNQVTGLNATATGITTIDLEWNTPADGGSPITGYQIERESPIGGGFSVIIANTGNTLTTLSDSGLTDSTQYNYRISAINAIGTGLASNEADATTFTPEEAVEDVSEDLEDIINANPGTPLADKLEDANALVETALFELNKTPPDNQAAMGNIEGAVNDIQAAVDAGDLDAATGAQLMDDLAGIARQIAVDAIDTAIATPGSDPVAIVDAQQFLADGDALRAASQFKDAVAKYKDALAKAESALP